ACPEICFPTERRGASRSCGARSRRDCLADDCGALCGASEGASIISHKSLDICACEFMRIVKTLPPKLEVQFLKGIGFRGLPVESRDSCELFPDDRSNAGSQELDRP